MGNIEWIFETKAGRVTDRRLPGAIFEGRAGYEEFAPERRLYEAAVVLYAEAVVGRVKRAVRQNAEWALRESLLGLGHSEENVRWHIANPGKRESVAFGCAEALYG